MHELIVVGTSWGGLHALQVLLRGLPPSFDVPIAVVQHRRADSDDTLVHLLSKYTHMVVGEAEDKEPVQRNRVYVAPPDYHLMVEGSLGENGEMCATFALSTEAPVIYSRPSIDVLFETAADAVGDRLIGILMTGANHDGASGLLRIKARGGLTIAQDPATAEVATMPRAAVDRGAASRVLPLEDIAGFLQQLRRGSERPRRAHAIELADEDANREDG